MDIDRKYFEEKLQFVPYQTDRSLLMYELAKNISLNKKNDLLLKGGTALLFCYGLNRFSTDFDYDGMKQKIDLQKCIEDVFKNNNLNLTDLILKKDTDTVKRYMLHYKEAVDDPIKLEISFRNIDYFKNNNYAENINNLYTYPILILSRMKIDTFLTRTKARDVFDTAFLLQNYAKTFDEERIIKCYNKLNDLGLNYFENLINEDKIIKNYDTNSILINFENTLKTAYDVINKQINEKNDNIQKNQNNGGGRK